MLKKFRNFVYGASVALACGLPALAFGQENNGGTVTTTPIVDTSTIQQTIITALGTWILIGIGIGISCLAVFLGWKWLKRFIGR